MRVLRFLVLIFFLSVFFSCEKDYSYEGGPPTPEVLPAEAVFTLVGSPNTCSNFKIEGNYKIGTPLNINNKVIVQVNVKRTGTFFISTNEVNEMSFKAVSEFTTTGIKELVLQGEGIPNKEGDNLFEIIAGTTNCSFTINTSFDLTQINRSDSAWQFVQGAKTYRGFLDGALTHLLNGTTVVTLVGLTPTKDTAVAIIVNIPSSSTVKTGTYISPSGASFLLFNSSGTTLFTSENSGGLFTVTITKYDPVTQLVEGMFSGIVLNSNNQQVAIAHGNFKAVLNQ